MNEKTKGILTIYFVDGSEQKFEYTRVGAQDEYKYSIAGIIQEALSQNQLLLELEDRVLIIPFQSIKTIELSPPPPKLPGYALKDVRYLA